MPLVSVIVAVFQAENYLKRCVESVLNQTLQDVEVLLVNDGSTDRSGELCDEYARNDARVRVFHKSHSGVSDTRQMGLDNAIGEYVIHCDSDDWMEPDMLRIMYEKAKSEDVDMVVCDYWNEYVNKHKRYKQFPRGYNANKPLENQIGKLSFHVWNKLVKRALFDVFNISFPKGMPMAEDIYVVMSLLNNSIKVAYVDQALCHYDCFTNTNHITAQYSREDIECIIDVISRLTDELQSPLHRKLRPIKRVVIMKAREGHLIPENELKKIYPEVQLEVFLLNLLMKK